jgi:Sulfotransferase family
MLSQFDCAAPIAIGGVGGSGTRLIAQFAIDLGVYMGQNLNDYNDNLLFTVLFKRPRWQQSASADEVRQHIRLFETCMTGRSLNLLDYTRLASACFQKRIMPWQESVDRAIQSIKSRKLIDSQQHLSWGWKEPNTQIFIEPIAHYFPRLRYIHVMRHGLDMAYSSNRLQLKHWGCHFGVEMPTDEQLMPGTQLEYWIRSSQKTIQMGTQLLGDRFYLLNYDCLCLEPVTEITKLLQFLGVDRAEERAIDLAQQVSSSSSMGRYRSRDLSIFSTEQLAKVEDLGFKV